MEEEGAADDADDDIAADLASRDALFAANNSSCLAPFRLVQIACHDALSCAEYEIWLGGTCKGDQSMLF